jgi:hypothetical protein
LLHSHPSSDFTPHTNDHDPQDDQPMERAPLTLIA